MARKPLKPMPEAMSLFSPARKSLLQSPTAARSTEPKAESRSISPPELENPFSQTNPSGQTSWALLSRFPRPKERSRQQWIDAARLTVEHICGYASIPIDIAIDMDIKPEDVIQGKPWKFMRVQTSLSFLREPSRPKFGDAQPDRKSTKVHADYVWKSML